MSKTNKLILLIAGIIVVLLLGCGFKSFNTFTPDDIPLLLRTHARNSGIRDKAFAERQIRRIARTPEGLVQLIYYIEDNEGMFKHYAQNALWGLASDWYHDPNREQEALDLLFGLIEHENPSVRKYAYGNLFSMASYAYATDEPEKYYEMRELLISGLEDPSFDIADDVVDFIISRHNWRGEEWIYPIEEVKGYYFNGDAHTRLNAAITLAYIDPDNHDPIQLLLESLQNSERDRQRSILRALSNYGIEVPEAIPIIMDLVFNDPALEIDGADTGISDFASMAFYWTGVGDGSVIDSLIELMYDENPHARRLAVESLGRLRADAVPALPALKVKLEDENETDFHIPMQVADSIVEIYRVSTDEGVQLDEIEYLLGLIESDRLEHQFLVIEGLHYFADDPRALEAIDMLKEVAADAEEEGYSIGNLAEDTLLHIEISHGIRDRRTYSLLPHEIGAN